MRQNKVKLSLVVLLFGLLSIISGCSHNNNGREFLITYTSFSNKLSYLIKYKGDEIEEKVKLDDMAIENLTPFKDKVYFSSRNSGHFYTINKEMNLKKQSIKKVPGITNIVRNSPAIITNGGQFKKEGKIFYKSGLFSVENKKEYIYEKGFYTTGVQFKGSLYVLSFDPSVEQEKLLKITNGEILKEYNLSSQPIHQINSISVFNNKIVLVSDTGEITLINDDNIEKIPLKYGGTILNVGVYKEKLYILNNNGELISLDKNMKLTKVNLEDFQNEKNIYIDYEFSGNSLFILSTYAREDKKLIGELIAYSPKTGLIQEKIKLKKIGDLRVTSIAFQ